VRQVLLYRKHVITSQPYIAQLVRCLEAGGVRPVPIFINGVEAVRGPTNVRVSSEPLLHRSATAYALGVAQAH
jgi:hypothetical protein